MCLFFWIFYYVFCAWEVQLREELQRLRHEHAERMEQVQGKHSERRGFEHDTRSQLAQKEVFSLIKVMWGTKTTPTRQIPGQKLYKKVEQAWKCQSALWQGKWRPFCLTLRRRFVQIVVDMSSCNEKRSAFWSLRMFSNFHSDQTTYEAEAGSKWLALEKSRMLYFVFNDQLRHVEPKLRDVYTYTFLLWDGLLSDFSMSLAEEFNWAV